MKQLIYTLLLFIFSNIGYAQFVPMPNTGDQTTYVVKRKGNENILKNAGNISAVFIYDSIGKNWNLPTENDYLRFKILHFYILAERRAGEHWKKMYVQQKTDLNTKFNRHYKGNLKRKKFKISTEFGATDYILKIYFFDSGDDVQSNQFYAIYQFTDRKSGEIVLQYHIAPKEYEKLQFKNGEIKRDKIESDPSGTFLDISIAMSRYFKKYIKN